MVRAQPFTMFGESVSTLTDEEIVRRVLAGETPLFELIVRRHNQRLFRVARAILRDDDVAEATTGVTLSLLIERYGVPVPNLILLQTQ